MSIVAGSAPKIAVVRALQLGDLLVAVPALRSLRAGFPDAEITLIGLPWAASLIPRFGRYLDRFVSFAGYPGIAEAPVDAKQTERFLREQRANGYDFIIQLHGDGTTSNALALALGGRVTAGYYRDIKPDGLTYSAPYPDHLPEILRNLDLVKLLGCPDVPSRLEFPLTDADRREAAALLGKFPLDERRWVGIHAGARAPARRWPAERFAAVADALAERHNARIVLTGAADEADIAQAVARHMTREPLVLVGQTSLGGLAAVIEALDLFISNDTGPAHLAVALDTPSVVLFGPADHRRWAPLDRRRHRVVRRDVPCNPCGHWACPIDHRCLTRIEATHVLGAANALLAQEAVTCAD